MTRCNCSWCDDREHKDFHGYQIGDDEPARHKKAGKKKTKRYKGCPDRDGRAHIYVWIEYFGKEWSYGRNERGDLIHMKKDVHWFDKRCVGCNHKTNRIYDWGSWRTYSRSPAPSEIYETRHVDYGYWSS